jgi:hypothetical protein
MKGRRKTLNKGVEEERWKCRMKGMEDMRNCMEEYRAKYERNEGMEEDVVNYGRGNMEVYDV